MKVWLVFFNEMFAVDEPHLDSIWDNEESAEERCRHLAKVYPTLEVWTDEHEVRTKNDTGF